MTNNAPMLLIGYYGKGNMGDDWLEQNTAKLIDEGSLKYRQKIILSPSISAFLKGIIIMLFKSPIVIFGGGSIFQDQTSNRSFWYYYLLLRCSIITKRRTILLGQGIGPLRSHNLKRLKKYLKLATCVNTRDSESTMALQKDIPSPPLIETTDLAFLSNPVNTLLPTESTDILALSLRSHSSLCTHHSELATIAHTYQCIGISCQKIQDIPALSSLDIHPIYQINPMRHTKNLPRPHIVISMRYHACIWAALHHIPFIALSTDSKLTILAKQLNQPMITLNTLAPLNLNTIILDVQKRYKYYKEELKIHTEEHIKKATKIRTYFYNAITN